MSRIAGQQTLVSDREVIEDCFLLRAISQLIEISIVHDVGSELLHGVDGLFATALDTEGQDTESLRKENTRVQKEETI